MTMFLIATSVPISLLSADLPKAAIMLIVREGNRLFEAGNALLEENPGRAAELYADALLHFERAVFEGGVSNGKLYYNIGNTYYRLGDIGRAILNYRRSMQLMPRDANLLKNLDYARSNRVDTIEETANRKALAMLLFWHYGLPFWTRLTVFSICFGLFWICAALKVIFKGRAFFWILIIIAMPASIFLGSVVADTVGRPGQDDGVIVATSVIARKGNADTYQPSFSEPLHSGTEFSFIERRADWYYVELLDGRKCWIPGASTELLF